MRLAIIIDLFYVQCVIMEAIKSAKLISIIADNEGIDSYNGTVDQLEFVDFGTFEGREYVITFDSHTGYVVTTDDWRHFVRRIPRSWPTWYVSVTERDYFVSLGGINFMLKDANNFMIEVLRRYGCQLMSLASESARTIYMLGYIYTFDMFDGWYAVRGARMLVNGGRAIYVKGKYAKVLEGVHTILYFRIGECMLEVDMIDDKAVIARVYANRSSWGGFVSTEGCDDDVCCKMVDVSRLLDTFKVPRRGRVRMRLYYDAKTVPRIKGIF